MREDSISDKPIYVISAEGSSIQNWKRNIAKYRSLLRTLAIRELKTKYAHTFAGWLWLLLNPALNFLILLFVFKIVLRIDSNEIPLTIVILSGLLIWQPFSSAINAGGESFSRELPILKKLYFPRIYIPASKLVYVLIETVVLWIIIALYLLVYYLPYLNFNFFALIWSFLILFLSSVGGCLLIAGLTMKYRDVHYFIPFVVRIGFFITPVGYLTQRVPIEWTKVYYLNPAVGGIELIRSAFLNSEDYSGLVWVSTVSAILLFLSGIFFFYKSENYLADTL